MPDQDYEVVVIGAGPGGYVAAIRAASEGLSVALVDRSPHLGGTCLNVGCIPTKALLESAKTWHKLQKLPSQGFSLGEMSFDWSRFLAQKDKIVDQQRRGLRYLMKRHGVSVVEGEASFRSMSGDAGEHAGEYAGEYAGSKRYGLTVVPVQVGGVVNNYGHQGTAAQKGHKKDKNNSEINSSKAKKIRGDHVIIATGSHIRSLSSLPKDHPRFHNSDSILALEQVPHRLLVIGGGVIGMEFASLFAMLGTEVTVLEYSSEILAAFDRDLVNSYLSYNKSLSLNVRTGVEVVGCSEAADQESVVVKVRSVADHGNADDPTEYRADQVLVCVGRAPNSAELNLAAVSVQPDAAGFIPVNDDLQVNKDGLYAIGDVISGPALAHSASAQALHVVSQIISLRGSAMESGQVSGGAGRPVSPLHHHPMAIYTYPEIATVGWSEKQLQEKGVEYRADQFPFSVVAKAKIAGEDMGFIKLLSDKDTGEILGVQVVGARATDMISEPALAMALECTVEEWAQVIRPHPTLSEIHTEVAHGALDHPIHL